MAGELTIKKHEVHVPDYEDGNVTPEYHAVPAPEYLVRAKEALERFIVENKSSFILQSSSLYNNEKVYNVNVLIKKNKKIVIDCDDISISIKPTNWGTDTVGSDESPRFWYFDGVSIEDINLIATSKKIEEK